MRKVYVRFLILFFLYGCEKREKLFVFSDNFNSLSDRWVKNQVQDSSRYRITENPIVFNDSVLQFFLHPKDKVSSGRRAEFTLKTKDTIGLIADYSFKVLFPESFFDIKKEQDWIMVHQWHDKPPKGVSWLNYNMQTRPPSHLFVQVNPTGKYYFVYAYGLWNKCYKNITHYKYEEPIVPNKWYSFQNTIKWSMDDSGFSIPKINDHFLVNKEDNDERKVLGANMYNDVPNYFKMGLYGNNKQNDTITAYFNDFDYTLFKNN